MITNMNKVLNDLMYKMYLYGYHSHGISNYPKPYMCDAIKTSIDFYNRNEISKSDVEMLIDFMVYMGYRQTLKESNVNYHYIIPNNFTISYKKDINTECFDKIVKIFDDIIDNLHYPLIIEFQKYIVSYKYR